MANPTRSQVNARTAATHPEPVTTTTTTTTTPPAPEDAGEEKPQDEPKADKGADTKATRYHVLKAITLADGRTVMPGEEWTPDVDFPARRPKQLVDQKFLRPIE